MKTIKALLYTSLLALASCTQSEDLSPSFYECTVSIQENPNHNLYQSVLNDMTASGVVGVEMSVHTNEYGLWLGAGGKADLHNNINMKPCNITRVGSTIKMFTATLILQLQEEGLLNLDDKISDYLQNPHIESIPNANQATIRQLLHHSSGIYNYIQNLQFQTASLNDLIKEWTPNELLEYAHNKAPYFAPSEDVRYSNTGYILLGLLIEQIENKPLYQVFEEKIIIPMGLSNTQFAGKDPVPNGIVRGYIDLYSNLQVIESTYYSGWDYYTADGGLISNVNDLNVFFRALMSGQLINQNSLDEMLDWKAPNEQDSEFYEIYYGLGIFKMITPKGECYFHSGDAIGYYANMMYFPEDSTTVVYAVNSNYGKIDQYVSSKGAMEKIILATKD
ncbi:MAG TPA: serine hydrolase domain-containing protein [Flavobacterium sp.]|nr:serine hydrolase domain-containing protein [Flavobacterium sp.]